MQIVELLRSMDIFDSIDDRQLQEIAGLLEEHRIPAGTALFREGDAGDSMLIVTAGRIRLSTNDPSGRERVLAVFGDGEFFGETGVLTGEARTANATADVDSGVVILAKPEFDRFIAGNPAVMRAMLRVIAQRQALANQRLIEDDDEGTAQRRGSGNVLSVFSPRGGSGKTTIAVNLALALVKQFADRVALVDLGVTFSHDALLLGMDVSEGLAAIEPDRLENLDRETLNRYAYLHDSGLRLFTAAVRPEEGESVSGEHVKSVLELMKRQFLFIVIDLPSNFNEPTLAAIEMSDRLLLVVTPELAVLRDMREVLRLFNDTIRVPRSKQFTVLNWPSSARVLSREQIEDSTEMPLNAEIPHGGDGVYRAYVKGEPVMLSQPGAPFSKAIERIAAELVEASGAAPTPPSPARGRLLGKLFSKRS